jgi:helicase MOV-10
VTLHTAVLPRGVFLLSLGQLSLFNHSLLSSSRPTDFCHTMPNCPNVLAQGTCAEPDCQYDHHILVCEPCGFLASSEIMLQYHLQDRRHHNRVSGRSVPYYCSVCKTNVPSANWDQHIGGLKHLDRARLDNVAPNVEPLQGSDVGRQRYCNICKVATQDRHWELHQRSAKHLMREKYALYRAALDEAEKDKNGVVVEGNFDFDFVDPALAAVGVHSTIFLKTATPNLRVRLISLNRVSSRTGTDTTSVAVLLLISQANRETLTLQLLCRS